MSTVYITTDKPTDTIDATAHSELTSITNQDPWTAAKQVLGFVDPIATLVEVASCKTLSGLVYYSIGYKQRQTHPRGTILRVYMRLWRDAQSARRKHAIDTATVNTAP